MPYFTENYLENMMENEIKEGETFSFECLMCGGCCRNRREPILITGPDVFRASKTLGIPPKEMVSKKALWHMGDTSHLPLLTLKQRNDGSCSFLRKGKCMIHENKPVVCAIFPLGRFFNFRDGKYHYFSQGGCNNSKENGRSWTVEEWLDNFNIHEADEMTIAWNQLISGVTAVTAKVEIDKMMDYVRDMLAAFLYLNYDISRPYVDQVEQNKLYISALIKSAFGKRVVYPE